MQNLVEHEVNADLYNRIHYLYDNIRQLNSLENVAFVATEPIDIQKVNKPAPSTFRLKDTVLYNRNIKAYMPYRQLSTTEIGRAHVWTPVTLIYLVCRLLLEKKKKIV